MSNDAAEPSKKRKKHLVQRRKRSSPAEGGDGGSSEAVPKKKSAAQLRRLEKRASKRDEAALDSAEEKMPLSPVDGAPRGEEDAAVKKGAAMNAKERRLARRMAERNGEVFEETRALAVAAVADDEEEGGDGYSGGIPNVVFVGQLPYSAGVDDILAHFVKGCPDIPAGDIKVRILTNRETGKSKGMAFVELANAEQQHQALTLHRSYFGNGEGQRRRQVNVEKSAGGGRGLKRKRIDEARKGQDNYMQGTVERIIDDYCKKGSVNREVLEGDKHLMAMLKRCDAATVDTALDEFSERDVAELTNPAAYLTAVVCRKLAEGFDAKMARQEEHKKEKAAAARGSGGSKGGKGKGKGGKGGRGGEAGTRIGRAGPAAEGDTTGVPFETRFPSMAGRGRGPRRMA